MLGFDNTRPRSRKAALSNGQLKLIIGITAPAKVVKTYRFQSPGKSLLDFLAEVEKFTGIEK